jgi:arsenate reductase
MLVLYGIQNCDMVKKARRWLDARGITYRFHDFRRDGLDEKRLARWTRQLGWETLLNRRGTTWRQLPAAQRERIADDAGAMAAMLDHAALVKRPVLEGDGVLEVGFNAESYAALFKK